VAESERRLAAVMSADVVGYARLMGADEVGTHERLKTHRRELVEPSIEEFRGRIVKTVGDGVLAEFPSALDAVRCAVRIQETMPERNAGLAEDERIRFRIGLSLGDIIFEDGDIFGEGVNIAARLEALADADGIIVSGDIHTMTHNKLSTPFHDLGEQMVKNIADPVRMYRLEVGAEKGMPKNDNEVPKPQVRFCTSFDGTGLAYAVTGEGETLLRVGTWLTHLELDWDTPLWSHLLIELAGGNRLIQYDARGNGLSDWAVEDISFDAFVRDLEVIADTAGGDKFTLIGISQGAPIAIAYAARHPERVARLVLYGGYVRGTSKRGNPSDAAKFAAMTTIIREGWGGNNPAFRQMYTSMMMPEATPEQMEWFNQVLRTTTSPDNAARIREVLNEIDVTDDIKKVTCPALVLHCRNDAVTPFEEGRRMAAMLPDARFVALEGNNHLILEHEPAWPRFVEEVSEFLSVETAPAD
jgi:class 3 adenylate cyclase/pimeloyl-ACP methyl ester carboxylesterase